MILVTGASGFVGRSVMRLLHEQGRPVKAYQGRINDPLALRAELLDVETIIHLAGAEARDRVRLLRHVDVEGTERLLEEARRARVERVVLISHLNADPNALQAVLRAKGEQERLFRHSGLPYTILRSATLFGRDDRFLNVIVGLAAWTWPMVWVPGGGHAALQPFWVEDLARCVTLSLDRADMAGKLFEVAGEERLRYVDVVREVLRTAGMRRFMIRPSVKLMRPLSALLFGWMRRPPVTRFFMDRFTVPEVAPIDNVRRYFGFQPARMRQHMAYVRRPRPGLHLFRLSQQAPTPSRTIGPRR